MPPKRSRAKKEKRQSAALTTPDDRPAAQQLGASNHLPPFAVRDVDWANAKHPWNIVPPAGFRCPRCPGFVFRWRRYMAKHCIEEHGLELKYMCELCFKYFSTPRLYRNHLESVHDRSDAKEIVKKTDYLCIVEPGLKRRPDPQPEDAQPPA